MFEATTVVKKIDKKIDFSLQTQKCVVLQKEIVLSVLRQLMRNTGGH